MTVKLAALAADPSRVADVAPQALPALLGELEALRSTIWAQLQAAAVLPPGPATPTQQRNDHPGADRLLTVTEVAIRLGVDRRWVYRRADALPFTRRLSRGTLRFSERGLERWQETRKGGARA